MSTSNDGDRGRHLDGGRADAAVLMSEEEPAAIAAQRREEERIARDVARAQVQATTQPAPASRERPSSQPRPALQERPSSQPRPTRLAPLNNNLPSMLPVAVVAERARQVHRYNVDIARGMERNRQAVAPMWRRWRYGRTHGGPNHSRPPVVAPARSPRVGLGVRMWWRGRRRARAIEWPIEALGAAERGAVRSAAANLRHHESRGAAGGRGMRHLLHAAGAGLCESISSRLLYRAPAVRWRACLPLSVRRAVA